MTSPPATDPPETGRLDRVLVGLRRRGLGVVAGAILIFMFLPLVVVVGAAFNPGSSITFPPDGLSLRWFREMFSDPAFRRSLRTSFELSMQTSIITAVIGTAFALAATRTRGRLFAASSALANLPMVLPGVLIGVALFTTFIYAEVPLGSRTALAGQVVYVLPYVIAIATARLRDFDTGLEEAARVCGYSRNATVLFVTLRMTAPALLAGAVLAFAFSFDEVFITNFVIGRDSTVPVYILVGFRRGVDPRLNAVAAMLMLVPISLIAVAGIVRYSSTGTATGPRITA